MEDLKPKESPLDLNKSVIISNIYAVLVTTIHFIAYYFGGENSKIQILKPYFLNPNSAGNILTIYIWALFDAFTVCSILLLVIKLKEIVSQKDDFSNRSQINS